MAVKTNLKLFNGMYCGFVSFHGHTKMKAMKPQVHFQCVILDKAIVDGQKSAYVRLTLQFSLFMLLFPIYFFPFQFLHGSEFNFFFNFFEESGSAVEK